MRLFRVSANTVSPNVHYWRGESPEWVLARFCDMFSLTDEEIREMSVEEVSLEEAKHIIIPSYCCQRFDDTPLSRLFVESDNGVTCLAVGCHSECEAGE